MGDTKGGLFRDTDEADASQDELDGLTRSTAVVSILFALIPHAWMCFRHGIPWWNGCMMIWTVLYTLNVASTCIRFLSLTERTRANYSRNLEIFTFFQALSWGDDGSGDLFDPFVTRNDAVLLARQRLKVEKVEPLDLALQDSKAGEEAQIWWRLRELVIVDLKDERILGETLVVVCIAAALCLGGSSLVVAFSLKEMTAITVVTAAVQLQMLPFTYFALTNARDLNLMAKEHVLLLHSVVANMSQRPPRSLDNQLRQERFLVQLATLIEKSAPPETVASFPVTPELCTACIGVQGVLTCVALWNLTMGIGKLAVS